MESTKDEKLKKSQMIVVVCGDVRGKGYTEGKRGDGGVSL